MQSCAPRLELLAPAGSVAQLKAAICFGADAVYLGLNEFSARAKAVDFSLENLAKWVSFAHKFNVRVYVAFNVLIKENEFSRALAILNQAQQCDVDAFIMQDFGLIQAFKKSSPNAHIHLSTQGGVHNAMGAKIAKQIGCERVVLSREAQLSDIKDIKSNCQIELEAFTHGALCVSFSGNCYFSSLVSGYSGNRGRCMQLCRKKYTALDEQGKRKADGYLLSSRDLCLTEHIGQLAAAGICSLKIEGRLRRAEYVAEAVRVYRAIIDGKKITKNDLSYLAQSFNRGGFTEGYLFESSPSSIIYPAIQGHLGERVGTVVKLVGKRAVLKTAQPLNKGDGIKFVGKRGESGGGQAFSAQDVGFKGNVRIGDEAWLTTNTKRLAEIQRILAEFERNNRPE